MKRNDSLWSRLRSRFQRVTNTDLLKVLSKVLMNEAEAINKINLLVADNEAKTEILKKVQEEIQVLIDNRPTDGQLSPEFEAALNALESSQSTRNEQLKVADDKNPDAEPEPDTGGEEPVPPAA